MSLPSFMPSKALTMGVELELQLINLADFDLTPIAPAMLELLAKRPFPGVVTPEITESMIEINSSIHTCHADLLAQLQAIRDILVQAGDALHAGVCGGGTHPFQQWSKRRIFDKPRFQEVSALYGYLAKQFTVFGQHIHIGCSSGDDALFLLHALNRYVPHFIALAASSPFFQGYDTQFNSARLNSVFAFPMSGRAPFLLRWDEFERDYFALMEKTGIVKSMKDFYWDIRPKPEYGTIELRVCDTPLSVDTAAALAGYLQALCAFLLARNEPAPLENDYMVYTYNRFQACRFGLEGTMVHPQRFEALSLREDILGTLRQIQPCAEALGSTAALDHLRAITETGSDAHFLRQSIVQSGRVETAVGAALGRFRAGATPMPDRC